MNGRLQEIKRKVMTFNQELREIDLEEHVDWLVEQAERVQELESDSYNARLERLLYRKEQEIERYREALEFYAERVYELESDSYNAHLERLLDKKEQEIERYREALSIISANLPLDEKEHYVYIARQALEDEE